MSAEKLDGNKDISITYTYDADGMRTGKTVTTKNYTLLHTHSYTKTVVEPTCTEKGYTLYQCACGYSYQDDWVSALGHRRSIKRPGVCIRCGCFLPPDDQIILPVEPKPPVEIDSVGTGYAISALPGTQDLGSAESTELVLQSTVVKTYSYVYTGSRLTQETVTTVTTTDEGTETTTDTLDYFYGVNGPTMVTWNGTDYYYMTNVQGDIVALLDESGNSVVQYSYDAWGHHLSTTGSMADTLGSRNSLRYRGYVFDTETGLYYLQSRYFNPKMARFINADALVSTGQGLLGNNMFAYCLNNPVNFVDRSGNNAAAVQWWTSTMWWLCGADTVLLVGDIIYGAGILILGVYALEAADEVTMPQVSLEEEKEEAEPEPPDVTYPGDDPTKAPEGTKWKGKGEQGSKQGNYYNPETGESWHPDLDHPEPIGPHWDYRDPSGTWWRVGHGDIISLK